MQLASDRVETESEVAWLPGSPICLFTMLPFGGKTPWVCLRAPAVCCWVPVSPMSPRPLCWGHSLSTFPLHPPLLQLLAQHYCARTLPSPHPLPPLPVSQHRGSHFNSHFSPVSAPHHSSPGLFQSSPNGFPFLNFLLILSFLKKQNKNLLFCVCLLLVYK